MNAAPNFDRPDSLLPGEEGRRLDRRTLLAAGGGTLLGACLGTRPDAGATAHERLLAVHARVHPEGAGANHYPMAAEVLEQLEVPNPFHDEWVAGVRYYPAPIPDPTGRLEVAGDLGDRSKLGDWLEHCGAALERDAWPAVVARAVPRLVPGLAGAAFHGLIRTAHGVRSIERRDSSARRAELASGLAYWAATCAELPLHEGPEVPFERLTDHLATLHGKGEDVDFFGVTPRLCERALAPRRVARGASESEDLARLVESTTTAFLEMLVQERQRLWLLHAVTAPACVELLLPWVDSETRRRLVDQVHRGCVALFAAFGEPFEPRAHLRSDPAPWSILLPRIVETGSVHGLKLAEALFRFDRLDDPLNRSVVEQWLEWT